MRTSGCCAASRSRSMAFPPACGIRASPSLRGAKRRRVRRSSKSEGGSNPDFLPGSGLLRGACHRAALRADPLARNDDSFAPLRLQRPLRTGVERIERGRAADVESVPLLAAETQIGNRFRNVNLAEQLAVLIVAAHAILVRIAPARRTPDIPV